MNSPSDLFAFVTRLGAFGGRLLSNEMPSFPVNYGLALFEQPFKLRISY
jgi:hypothetical protein